MAQAYTQEAPKHRLPYKPITLVLDTAQEAYALRKLVGGSSGNVLYEIYKPFYAEYIKQKEVIDNAVG